jgi:hypothetical protein
VGEKGTWKQKTVRDVEGKRERGDGIMKRGWSKSIVFLYRNVIMRPFTLHNKYILIKIIKGSLCAEWKMGNKEQGGNEFTWLMDRTVLLH